MLGKAVELRNSSFLWVPDLSQADTIAIVAGFPVNVLPILMAGTMFYQMRLTPKTGDPMQQRIFMFMPFMFVMFCYNYASALALYWTVQNIFTIVQLLITNRRNSQSLQTVVSGGKK
jgi:YidC/Oxa1 family membrane protein insertase